MKISLRVVIIGFLFLLLYFGMSYIYLSQSVNTLYKSKYDEIADRMKRELEVLVKEKLEAVLLLDISLAQNQNIKDVLLHKKIGDLNLEEYALLLRENTPLKNIWFQIIDKKGVSLYRSWTQKKGDSLLRVRLDIEKKIKSQKMSSSISTGIFNMTFKSTVPVYQKGEFLGMVETIATFDSIVNKLKKYHFETLVLIDKSYKNQLTDTLKDTFIQDYYVSSFSGSKKLMDAVLHKDISYFLNIENYIIDKKNNQLVCLYKLPDTHGKEMGYFIMSIDLKNIDVASIKESKQRIIFGLGLGFFIITGFLFYLYMVNYKNFIQAQREELKETVEQQTRELRKKSEEMTHLAHHDSLTDLPNRLLFLDRLTQGIKHAKRQKQELGVLFLDLDRFKEVNDTYGHEMGDLLLQLITNRLKLVLREEDTVARLGGDEFTVILQNSSHRSLEVIAEKIIYETQKPIILHGIELFATFSIGISVYPHDGDSAYLLLKYADTAMYRAKEKGKNTYQFYNASMTEMTMSKLTLQNSLRDALKYGEFEPYYQPKMDALTGKVIGLEGLVRWNHPKKGLVPPINFIPFAEEIGLIVEIDTFMLYATLTQMKEWHEEGLETGQISLNISSNQLDNFNSVASFKKAIHTVDFDTKYLELEVTEGQIMKSQSKAIEILNQIKGLGISISMDDFGTGYSSLSYLKNLPVDKLKIDRSFVEGIPHVKDDVAIVKTIISLAKNLGLDLIAEGVETKEQVDFLANNGCSKIQGYYYSKPLCAKECREFLIKNG